MAGPLAVASQAAAQQTTRRYPRPAPKYEVRLEPSVPIPLRDGVRLSTDLFFPEGRGGPQPVILMRTPYDKEGYIADYARWFASQGYVVAVQDKRGRFESEGAYVVQGSDVLDGYDTIDWLVTRPWSNGNIGMYGCSYLGDVQLLAAQSLHPNLKALIPQAATSVNGQMGERYRYFGVWNGGALELALALTWFRRNGSKVFYGPPPDTRHDVFVATKDYFDPRPQLPDIDYPEVWSSLPIIDMMERAKGPYTDWRDIVTRRPTDPWWNQFGYLTDTTRFDVPALHIDSWYDFGPRETLAVFELMQRNARTALGRDHQYAIMSPTQHCASEGWTRPQTVIGDRPLGDAQFDFWNTYLRWYERWLKGVDNGILDMPKVQYYVMGRNEWRSAAQWPVPGTRHTRFYLHSDGRANSRFGTGTLNVQSPGPEPPDSFRYDPATPVPMVGGPLRALPSSPRPGGYDQRTVETRHDVLVYTTAMLEEGVEVTGNIDVVLYVSSSAEDTDFTAKLVDVHPDGTAYNLVDGIKRARYREGFDRWVWMEPDQVYQVEIDLQATSNYFPPGHRIRLEVSSSNFPRYDRNMNTGGDNVTETQWKIARNVVYHSAEYPSHVLLPIIADR